MWRRRANRLLFSLLVALVVVPTSLYLAACVAIGGMESISGVVTIVGLPALIALHIALDRIPWLPESCLPPYPSERK